MSGYVRRVTRPVKTPASRLGMLDIELTERCNNRCIHCYINQPEDDPEIKTREMDTAFVQDILRQVADLGCLTVRFTGGEPLIRDDFTELYLFARRLGLKILIFTNARLITPELAKLFARIPPGKPMEISVYGMRARSYDAVAGVPGAFEEFQRGMGLLQEHRVPFVVKQSLLPQNRDELPEFESFASTLTTMDAERPDYAMNFDLRARRDDQAKNKVIQKLRVSPAETLAMVTRDQDEYLQFISEFSGRFMEPPGKKLFSCGAGCRRACIDAYGNAQVCMLLRHPNTVYPLDSASHRKKHPEIGLAPLEYALSEFFPKIRRIQAENSEYLQRCAQCFLKGLCEQCPAKSWEEHGILDAPVEYLCEVAHAQARWLGWLGVQEHAWTVKDWKERIRHC